jgi:hypothetical protein
MRIPRPPLKFSDIVTMSEFPQEGDGRKTQPLAGHFSRGYFP